ncbi:MAG: tetratricopeptide repeat protein, partial [Methanotrichaceae archaeon]|nr:tetratricopeptide repeat protein [Methanotrichaceae archaeon]
MELILILISFAVICAPAFGQTTAIDWLKNGTELQAQGKLNEAIQAYNKAIEINPQYADAWSNKGICLGIQGKYDEAIEA